MPVENLAANRIHLGRRHARSQRVAHRPERERDDPSHLTQPSQVLLGIDRHGCLLPSGGAGLHRRT